MKKILYALLNGEVNKSRVQNVMYTWGKDVDLIFYSDFDDLENKVYKVTDKKGYWDLEEKHVLGLKYVNSNFPNYDWYFFCDDDTFVNTDMMNKFINNCKEDVIYGCLINCWPVDRSLFFHSGGAGVLIHKNNLSKISEKISVLGTSFADVTLGLFLRQNNFSMETDSRFHTEAPSSYGKDVKDAKDNITFHHIKTMNEMMALYNSI